MAPWTVTKKALQLYTSMMETPAPVQAACPEFYICCRLGRELSTLPTYNWKSLSKVLTTELMKVCLPNYLGKCITAKLCFRLCVCFLHNFTTCSNDSLTKSCAKFIWSYIQHGCCFIHNTTVSWLCRFFLALESYISLKREHQNYQFLGIKREWNKTLNITNS